MAAPDFSRGTIDLLGKRAGYLCSNPECRAATVGPSQDENKATLIGEAAHIRGARPTSARYSATMTDTIRAEVTNGIWLCRNCHKFIDADVERYPTEVLFKWREQHETYVATRLGSRDDRLLLESRDNEAAQFEDAPLIVRRIVLDRPAGWEWRLTAELLRYQNEPIFRRLDDLHNGLRVDSFTHIEAQEVVPWSGRNLKEMSRLLGPIEPLLERLTKSWGALGESGDLEEIRHTCGLINATVEQCVAHEERLYFSIVPEDFETLKGLMVDAIGSQVLKLQSIPSKLDEAIELALQHADKGEEPMIMHHTIEITLPDGWVDQIEREYEKAVQLLNPVWDEPQSSGWSSFFLWLLVGFLAIFVLSFF